MTLIDTRTPNKKNFIAGATGDWEVIIGMEVHAQVLSESKLFSGSSTEFGSPPNANVSFVDAAMPGMLPVINEECVRQAVRTGLGLKAASLIVALAGASRALTVVYSALAVWALGLAVPVTACYIIAAVMVVPALTQVGVAQVAAHMFVFYYAVLSEVSPPTALSPFAAAALTGGNPFRTTMLTWKHSLPAFLVPGRGAESRGAPESRQNESLQAVEDGLALTGHFLENRLFAQLHTPVPQARARLLEVVRGKADRTGVENPS